MHSNHVLFGPKTDKPCIIAPHSHNGIYAALNGMKYYVFMFGGFNVMTYK